MFPFRVQQTLVYFGRFGLITVHFLRSSEKILFRACLTTVLFRNARLRVVRFDLDWYGPFSSWFDNSPLRAGLMIFLFQARQTLVHFGRFGLIAAFFELVLPQSTNSSAGLMIFLFQVRHKLVHFLRKATDSGLFRAGLETVHFELDWWYSYFELDRHSYISSICSSWSDNSPIQNARLTVLRFDLKW